MKSSATSKPSPSPGRIVKYQPPLMRFLRSNAGSKSSRVRSRSIPLFTRRKRAAVDGHQQEPSSPKVTCIGQVRVCRSSSKSKQSGLRNRDPPPLKRRTSSSNSGAGNWFCFWVGKPPAICCSFRFSLCCRRKSSCFRPLWRKCVSFFCCRSVRVRTDSPKKGTIPTGSGLIYTETDSDSFDLRRHRFEDRGEEYEDDDEDEETEEDSSDRVDGSGEPTTPPKNALFLTRCRSAPQRSSYLASQFWGSPLKTEEGEEHKAKTGEQENREATAEEAAEKLGSSGIPRIQLNPAAESRIDREGEDALEIPKEQEAETESVAGLSNKAETTTMKTPTVTQKANPDEKQSEKEEEEEEEERIVVVLTRASEEFRRSIKQEILEGEEI
ncbi:hypothetical protein V2J09_010551 [Rumex salicifolius]